MSRPLRIQYPGAWYHIMNRGAGRRKIFITDKQRQHFLELLGELSKNYHVEVHCYCLMGNHYHLLVHTPKGNLSEAMRHLNSKYTRYFNSTQRSDGALFRGRYKSLLVSGEDYLLRLSRYIHQNPQKARIVPNLPKYQWSSYPAYIEHVAAPEWLKLDTIIRRFNKMRKKTLSYQQFVEMENDDELQKFYEKPKLAPVLGNQEFVEKIFKQLKDSSMSSEIADAKRVKEPPSIREIINETAKYFSVSPKTLMTSVRKKRNQARAVAMVLCREVGLCKLNEIAEEFGSISYSTVSVTMQRAKKLNYFDRHIIKLKNILMHNSKKCYQEE